MNPQPPQVIQQDTSGSDQLGKLEQKVTSTNLPDDLKSLLIDRIKRLALIRTSSGFMSPTYILEYESTATYINWVTSMPWNTATKDLLDLVTAKQILDKNHYGLTSVKDRMLEYLSSQILNLKNNPDHHMLRAPVLCLVGLAGTGKTSLASSMAQALGRKFERIPFGGIGDARVLRGQSRAYADAEPGSIVKKLTHAGSKNCVILLDELDRVAAEARADIMGVLLELLDPEQNTSFTDHYIDFPFDLSQVLFIATANNTTNISTAVLDRLEMIQMPSYSDEEKATIGKSYIFPKVRAETGLTENQIVIDESLWPNIIRPLGFDSGIRSLERTVQGMCRKVARIIIEKKVPGIRITDQNLREFLPSL